MKDPLPVGALTGNPKIIFKMAIWLLGTENRSKRAIASLGLQRQPATHNEMLTVRDTLVWTGPCIFDKN